MAKNIKSAALVFIVVLAFCVFYESSLRKIANSGKEWLRRHSSQFCEPGYRLHSEHCWHCDDGQTYYVFVFETTPMHRTLDPGVQVLLEDADHEELQRFNVSSKDPLMNTAVLESVHPNRLELVFRIEPPETDLYCCYWIIEGGRLVRADFVAT